jgi:hypothetical protein
MNFLRNVIFPILKLIKNFLEFTIRVGRIIKFYALPSPPRKKNITRDCYDIFEKEEIEKSYKNFQDDFLHALFLDSKKINIYAINKALENSNNDKYFFLEFGVFRGESINKFAEILRGRNYKIYGFDSFEGLREDWAGTDVEKGHFNLYGKIPKLKNNVIPIKGWVQDTLPNFLEKNNPLINFIHIDLDTYSSTKFVLERVKPYLQKGAILLFNEFYNYPGWSVGEYRAFSEVFNKNEYNIIAFSKHGWEAVVKIN